MIYGRVKGGRVWHIVTNDGARTVCTWTNVRQVAELPASELCQKCYAIREEQYAPYRMVGGELTHRFNA